MTPKSKFKPGEIVYYKYPSRYSRTKDPNTAEAILKIVDLEVSDTFRTIDKFDIYSNYFYLIKIVKLVKAKRAHWTDLHPNDLNGIFGVESLDIETYSRRLTPAETVLYGSNG